MKTPKFDVTKTRVTAEYKHIVFVDLMGPSWVC